MSNTKLTAFPAGIVPVAADKLGMVQAGVTVGVTAAQLRSAIGVISNASTSAQTPAATVRTYLAGSAIAVPASKLTIGSTFRWEFDVTKTAAGTATSTIDIAVGTAGTTADTARVSITKQAGTAAADTGYITIVAVCRGPLSAAGILSANFQLTHLFASTGLDTRPSDVVTVQSAGFDVTVANLIVGLCITTGAADAYTIQQVTVQAFNL